MSASISGEFNSNLLTLMKEISLLFPNNTKIPFYADMLKTKLIPVDPNKPIEQFIMYALPHKDKIYSGDEDFFVNHDYKKESNSSSVDLSDILQFKEKWNILTRNNKDVIIQYMQLLCSYGEEYLKCLNIH